MTTLASPATSVKPNSKARGRRRHERSVRWLARVGPSTGILSITQDGKADVYSLSPVPSEIGGEGFRFEKFDRATGRVAEEYHALVAAGDGHSCTCPGNTYHGFCKHVESVLALRHAGKL